MPDESALLAQVREALVIADTKLDEAREIIDVGEQRALVADGPVGHCRKELSNQEFDRMWRRVERLCGGER